MNYFNSQIDKFIEMDNIDIQEGVREFGRLLHTVQDSYSLAHTKRDNTGINEFYYYEDKEHDKDLHKQLDLVRDPKNGKFTNEAETAILASMKLLTVAYSNEEKDKNKIMEVIKEIFKLASPANRMVTSSERFSRKNENFPKIMEYLLSSKSNRTYETVSSRIKSGLDTPPIGTDWPRGGGETIRKSMGSSSDVEMPVIWPPVQPGVSGE